MMARIPETASVLGCGVMCRVHLDQGAESGEGRVDDDDEVY
jgi:hypothetical protein